MILVRKVAQAKTLAQQIADCDDMSRSGAIWAATRE
jgi:hypothetical protein